MNQQEILQNGTLEPSEPITAPEADTKPTVTNDEYVKLATLKGQQKQLKEDGFDVGEFITNGESQIASAKEQLASIREQLTTTTTEFQELFNSVTGRYGFSGNVTIEDSEPHYIYETPAPAA